MSAKTGPSAGGDNILARMDRGGAGSTRAPWSPIAIAAAAGGGLATLALLWLLISITQDNLQDRRENQAVTATATVLEPASQGQSEAPGDNQADARVSRPTNPHADLHADARADARADTRTETHAEKRADSPVDANSLEPIPVLPMLADVVEKAPAAASPVAAALPGVAAAPVARATPRMVRPHGAPRSGGSHASAGRTGQQAPSKGAGMGAGADAAIDSDVALLSAILMHAPRHSAERARAEAKCKDDKKCAANPLPALIKATD